MSHANVAIFVPHIGCPNQCSFCNQHSISGARRAPTPDEVGETCRRALEQMGERAGSAQIAFFGGSFTAIDQKTMVALLEAAEPYIGAGKFSGIRVSTRPDAVTDSILDLLERYHVTAIELGVQSMDREVLTANRRGHTPEDVEQACALIHRRKIELGLQMMTGLYLDTQEKDWETARRIASLSPQTVRIYPSLLLKGTPLEELYRQGLYRPQTLEEAIRLCSGLLSFFEGRNISVIRLGLQASLELQKELVDGPYHPAFRELCESRIYLERAREKMSHFPGKRAFQLFVCPTSISKMVGQKKQNLAELQEMGYQVFVKPDRRLSLYEVDAVPIPESGPGREAAQK